MDEQKQGETIRAIVGLGNPGRRYVSTRHNIGFMLVEMLADRLHTDSWRDVGRATVTRAALGDRSLALVKPQTFMNLSGQAVRELANKELIKPQEILVISDDLDLQFGRMRLRSGGSAGGHNGLKSIAEQLGTLEFPRLRIGVGRPDEGDPIEWVLSPFADMERAELPILLAYACAIVATVLDVGVLSAMNRHNGRGDVRLPESGQSSARERTAAPNFVLSREASHGQ